MSEAEELAERLEEMSECLASSSSRRTGRAAADLIRSQAVRIAELERRQIKISWNRISSSQLVAMAGPMTIGFVCQYPTGYQSFVSYKSSTLGTFTTESEARAAVESAAVKMMGGE